MTRSAPIKSSDARQCPYLGLRPYTEADRKYFFGRDRDQRIITSNLYAAPLTVLYGASGVGKSSVLLAGVVPKLKEKQRIAVVVFRNWQAPNILKALKRDTLNAVSESAGEAIAVDSDQPFNEVLFQATRAWGGLVFFIFDQFEEYFLYHPPSQAEEGFEAELARTVNRKDDNAKFLISMREDELSKLDRFKGRISNLLGNMLRVEHLDCAAAEEAIRKPLEAYALPDGGKVGIEDGLVNVLLRDTQSGKVSFSQAGDAEVSGKTAGDTANGRIETPLLQMVLTRLWDEEMKAGSRLLREKTLNDRDKLGGVDRIVRTHLDGVMQKSLSDAERETASSIFRYLVTPSGSKIAQEPAALARWADRDQREVESVLTKLSGDVRIVREVEIPNQAARYEVFHDVLGPAILEWGRRYEARADAARQQELSRTRRMRVGILALSLVVIGMGALLFYGLRQRTLALTSGRNLAMLRKTQEEDLRRFGQTQVHIRRGQLYSQQQEYDVAIAEFGMAIELDPKNANAYNFLGYAQMRHDHLPEAIGSFKESISLDSAFDFAHYNLADAYSQERRYPEALEELKRALELDCCMFRDLAKDGGQFRQARDRAKSGDKDAADFRKAVRELDCECAGRKRPRATPPKDEH